MPELTYTAEDLLTSIRNGGMIPNTGATGSEDDDLLRHASEGIWSYIQPGINQLREQYTYVRDRRALAAGQQTYRIPKRAMWTKLTNLWYISNTDRIPLRVIPKEDIEDYGISGTSGTPAGYVIDGNYIRIIPETDSFSGTFEWCYYLRPGNLVKSSEYRRVAALVGTDGVTLDSAVPTTGSAPWTMANTFDIHSAESGADYKQWSIGATVVSGTGITFDQNIDGSVFGTFPVEVGDYVCLENTVALPGVPPELFPQVARLAAMHWAEATGNRKKFEMHGQVLTEFLEKTYGSMEVRVEERPIVIGTKVSFLDYQGRGYW